MQEKPVPLIKIILFLIVSGMAPVIVGPWMYFQTDEPLYWVFPLIGAGG
ncbi:hypothetical protein [Oceanobacillus jeddahense]|uniref:Uncharacterized protein n=1 Tax=Oceanobacillus jeddahense TaxID=1462527 RepID=A0ABY5JXI4_9BACI|nr:hypothetical protein [Oceanobacillus jeddahense]UUI04504.1 hypothetical protein NP439_07580 [Oceanobacillus jeddahense]